MEFNKQNIQSKTTSAEVHVIDEGLRAYMLKVYNYMASGILITGFISLILFKMAVVISSRWFNCRVNRSRKCTL